MERPDIVGGIKQAIERGSSLDQAKASFINAGYSSQDVEDSSNSMGYSIPKNLNDSAMAPPLASQSKPLPTLSLPKKSHKTTILIIVLVLALVILLGSLLGMLFAKDTVLSILSKIGINL